MSKAFLKAVHNSKSLLCKLQNVCLPTWELHCWGIVVLRLPQRHSRQRAKYEDASKTTQHFSRFLAPRMMMMIRKRTIFSLRDCHIFWHRDLAALLNRYLNHSQTNRVSIDLWILKLISFLQIVIIGIIFALYGRVGSPLRLIVCQYQPDAFESLTIRLEAKTPTKIHSKANLEQFSQSIIIFFMAPFSPRIVLCKQIFILNFNSLKSDFHGFAWQPAFNNLYCIWR